MENVVFLDKYINEINISKNDILLLFRNNQETSPNLDIIESSIEEPDIYDKVLDIYKNNNIGNYYDIIEGKYLLCIFKLYNSRHKIMMKDNFQYLIIEFLKRLNNYNNILTYYPFDSDDKNGEVIFKDFISFMSKYIKITIFKHRGYNININYEKWLEKDAIDRNIRKIGNIYEI